MRKIILLTTILLIMQITKGQNSNIEETVFAEFKSLYSELLEFKGTSEFEQYGFATGGPYNSWLKKVQNLKNNPNSKLLIKRGFVVGELETLAFEYVSSKGRETELTQFFNEVFRKAIYQN